MPERPRFELVGTERGALEPTDAVKLTRKAVGRGIVGLELISKVRGEGIAVEIDLD